MTDDSFASRGSGRARHGRGWGRVTRAREAYLSWPVWGRIAVGIPAALLALALLAIVVDVAAAAGRIHPGLTIGPVKVGGMTRQAATQRVADELGPRLDDTIVVTFEDKRWEVHSNDLSATIDPASYAEEAFSVGRRGSVWRRVRERASLWFGGGRVEPVVTAEMTATVALMDSLDSEVGIAPVDATVQIEGTEASLVPAEVGRAVDRDSATRAVLSAFVSTDREVPLPMRLVPVAVTDADAEAALADARLMLSGPLSLAYEQERWQIEPDVIGGWIGFRQVPFGSGDETETGGTTGSTEETPAELPGRMVLVARLVTREVSQTVTPLTSDVGRSAVDARFSASNGVVTIIPGEVGLGVDMEALTDTLEVVLRYEDVAERAAALRMQALQPDLTTEEAEAMGIKERIATYTTTFSSSNAPRVNNIQTLAKALDGTLIPPGGVFSFNETVGPRTADKGYQEAGTIVNGRLVPTLGGGICQVCTTLFNSVFFAGLPVEQRSNHSFYISSYPTGRDATVSWGGPDFKFTNDTAAWVLIATGYSSSSVTISLYGTDPGYEIEYTTGPWTDIVPFTTAKVEDATLDEGIKVVEEGGVSGRTIVVTRRVLRDGRLIREDTFRSKYNPKQEIVRVGTRPVPASSEGTRTRN